MAAVTNSRWSVHVGAVLSGTALGQILSGVAQVLIVRTLGVAGYGQYSLLYAWLAIATALLGAGIDTWMLDAQSRSAQQLDGAIRRIVGIKCAVWICCLGSALIWLNNLPHLLILSGMFVILIDSLSSTGLQMLRGQNRHPLVAILQLIGPVVLLCAVVFGLASSVQQVVWIQLAVAGITSLTVAYQVKPFRIRGHADASRALTGAIPFVFSDVCAQIYTQSTTILVGSLMANTAVGIYRGAWSLVGYSFIVPAVLFQTTLPHLNAEARPNIRKHILLRTGVLFLLYAGAMGAFIAYGAPWVLPILYGQSFLPSAALLPAFAWIPLFKAMSFYAILILLMQKQIRRRIVVQVLVVTLVWLTAPSLIGSAGIAGAVNAQLLSEGFLGIGYLLIAAFSLRLTATPVWPPKRIVVTNLHGLANVGDAAIHQAQVSLLTRLFPQAQISLLYALPDAAQRRFPHTTVLRGVHSWVYGPTGTVAPLRARLRRQLVFGYALLVGRWMRIPRWGMTHDEHEALSTLQEADIVYATGGGYLYEAPTAQRWRQFVLWDWWLLADLLIAIAWGRPFVLMPQSIGPCSRGPFSRFLRWILTRAHTIYVRDSTSAALLSEWQITHRIAPDLAWSLPRSSTSHVKKAPILGVSALDWGAQYPAFSGQARYEDALVEALLHYAAQGWRIQLFSQCRETQPAWDDRLVSMRIAQRIGSAGELMPDYATPEALAVAYATVDCLVATRMHAAILRMSSGGTCVVIGYLPKAAALMSDLGLSRWHIPIASITSMQLQSAIDARAQQAPLLTAALVRIDEQRSSWESELVNAGGVTAEK